MAAAEKVYAGFWRRFAAFMIDTVILAFFLNTIFWILFNSFRNVFSLFDFDIDYSTQEKIQIITVYILFALLHLLASWCYYCGMESSPLQATLGKKFLGLYVTDLKGNRISFGKATLRFFLKGLSCMFLCAGYIMAAFTNNKQALHDLLAKCLVLRK